MLSIKRLLYVYNLPLPNSAQDKGEDGRLFLLLKRALYLPRSGCPRVAVGFNPRSRAPSARRGATAESGSCLLRSVQASLRDAALLALSVG